MPIKFPSITADLATTARDLTEAAKDAAYVVVGAGVLEFQKGQVLRHELLKWLGDPRTSVEHRLHAARSDLGAAIYAIDARVEELIGRLDAAVVPWEERLPDQARSRIREAHQQASDARAEARRRLLASIA